jgi:peptide/nickel transport system permease protein
MIDSVRSREVIVVQSLGLVLLLIVLVINFCTDLLYGVLDPRLRTPVRRGQATAGAGAST